MKKIKLLFIFVLLLILKVNGVNAIDYNNAQIFAENITGTISGNCNTGACFGFGVQYNNTSTFGIRITLIDKNGNTINNKVLDLWGTNDMMYFVLDQKYTDSFGVHDYTGGVDCDYNTAGKYIDYDSDLYNAQNSKGYYLRILSQGFGSYADYFNNELTVEKIKSYLSKMGITNVNEAINYYFKLEPIYALVATSGSSKKCMVGNTSEILNYIDSGNYYSAKEIAYADEDNGSNGYVSTYNWNVVRNFILTTYAISRPEGTNFPYFTGEIPSVNAELYDLYRNGNGLGVGYVKLSNKIECNCACEFDNSDKSMATRIKLYKKYGEKNLLNSGAINGIDACQKATCVNNNSTGCLSASIYNGVDFNADNLSCYNDTEKVGDKIAYCLTKFNLNSSFGSLGSASQPFIVTSGRFIFNSKVGTTGVLNRVCYLYGGSGTIEPLVLDDYINSFEYLPGETSVTSDPRITSNKDVYLGAGYTKYEDTVEIDFISPSIYADNISGVITYNNSSCSTCKFLGYGLISKLNETGSRSFETKLKTKGIFGDETKALTCHYKANPELIKEKLLLKFRIIDTSNPFPGPDALGREVGSNWCDAFDCTNENVVVKETIIEANNSYNKTGAGPKYSIILTSNDIQVIRKYNKETTYDDYNFTCSGSGYDCESKFLKGLVNGSLSYNGNFIGNVSNKLIIR